MMAVKERGGWGGGGVLVVYGLGNRGDKRGIGERDREGGYPPPLQYVSAC